MFEWPGGHVSSLSDGALIDELTACTRFEATVAARRLALIGEVTARQCDDEDDAVARQVIDGWAWAQAAVSAACNLNPYAASKQMRIARALRDRLPRTAALFGSGAVSATVIDAVSWRTRLVEDPDALALIDAAIAHEAAGYGAHSEKGLIDAVDLWVEKFDPEAVVRSRRAAKDLYVEFDDKDDPNGVSSFWGRLRVTDKMVLQQRLDDLADTVCSNDPRRRGELRAAAMAALGVVGPALQRLACLCGDPGCEGSGKDPRSGAVTIYALTEQVPAADQQTPRQTTPGAADTREPGPAGSEPATPGPNSESKPASEAVASEEGSELAEPAAVAAPATQAGNATPATPAGTTPAAGSELGEPAAGATPANPVTTVANPSPGVMLDGGIIPAAMLAELAATGAKIKPLAEEAALPAECRHRPSTALTAFVRMRSMTCSFPGCNKPAHRCDLDHVVPWPAGATHPGNLHPLCRLHHLLKTFCGWVPRLKPDGTVAWTAPTGHAYAKVPGAAILFPHWNIHTPAPPPGPASTAATGARRDAMMPTRRRTRAQDHAQRVKAERTRNAAERARERAEAERDPPPF